MGNGSNISILYRRDIFGRWRSDTTTSQSTYCMYSLQCESQSIHNLQSDISLDSGGNSYQYQLTEYDIFNDKFIDYGENYLSNTLGNTDGEFEYGAYFTQLDETTLFTINQYRRSINVYNLPSLSYHSIDTTIPIDVGRSACITSSQIPVARLYITGGSGFVSDLQIFNLGDISWVRNAPSMNRGRFRHGCSIVTDRLWVFGGYDEDSVEVINATSFTTSTWYEIGTLPCKLGTFGSTAVGSLIFIFGGYCYDPVARSNAVYIINTITKSIDEYWKSLPFALSDNPVIAINHIIYIFGGWDGEYLDSWLTLNVLRIFLCVLVSDLMF